MAFCYVAIGFATAWWSVMAALVLCWIVGGIQWPAIMTLLTESVPENKRGLALGMLEAMAMCGLTLGPFVGSRIEHAFERDPAQAWRTLLLLCAGLYLVSATVRGLVLRETHRPPAVGGEPASSRIEWWRLLLPSAAAIGVLATVMFFWTTDGPVAALYLKDELGRSRAEIDDLFVYAGLVALVAAPVAGWLVDRVGHVAVLRASFVLSAIVLAPFLVALVRGTHLHAMWPGWEPWLIIAFFLPSELFTVAFQRLLTANATDRAATVGAYGVVIGIASPWAYLAIRPLYRASHTLPLAAAAAIALVCLAISLRLRVAGPGRKS
jgi:MFS family permease